MTVKNLVQALQSGKSVKFQGQGVTIFIMPSRGQFLWEAWGSLVDEEAVISRYLDTRRLTEALSNSEYTQFEIL